MYFSCEYKLDFYIPCTSRIYTYAQILQPTTYVLGIILLPLFANINDSTMQKDGELVGQTLQPFCVAIAFPNE